MKVDVRVIACTNKNLEGLVEEGRFREDLYFRLNVIRIKVPVLRERKDDIIPLIRHFLQKYNQQYGCSKKLTSEAYNFLVNKTWPGNVRELSNFLERLVVISEKDELDLDTVKMVADQKENEEKIKIEILSPITLKEAKEKLERELLLAALKEFKTTRSIARSLGIDHSTVVRKMHKYGLVKN